MVHRRFFFFSSTNKPTNKPPCLRFCVCVPLHLLRLRPPDRESVPEAAHRLPGQEGRPQEGRVEMGPEPRPRVQDPA